MAQFLNKFFAMCGSALQNLCKVFIFFVFVACQNEEPKHSSLWSRYYDSESMGCYPAVADANNLWHIVNWLNAHDSINSRSEICFLNTKMESLFFLADSIETINEKTLDSLDFLFLNNKIDSARFGKLLDSLTLRTQSNIEYSQGYLHLKYFKANCDTCDKVIYNVSFDEFFDFSNKKDKNAKQVSDSIRYYNEIRNAALLDSLYLLLRKGQKFDLEKTFFRLKKNDN